MTAFDFSCRARLVEEMDKPDCSGERLCRTLAQFETINRLVSRCRSVLRQRILSDLARDVSRTHRLVDLGAGGCDIDRWLIDCCRRRRWKLQITAVEHDPRVMQYARAANRDYPEIQFCEADVLDARNLDGADYVFSNHLLHHLPDEQCVALLRLLDRVAPRVYLLCDIRRSPTAYKLFSCLAPLLFRRSFIAPDGLVSIRRSFTLPEAHALLRAAAPAHPVCVRSLPPGRLVIEGGCACPIFA
ncbi:MAG: methyltransferase domain-containing protein [bacterium]